MNRFTAYILGFSVALVSASAISESIVDRQPKLDRRAVFFAAFCVTSFLASKLLQKMLSYDKERMLEIDAETFVEPPEREALRMADVLEGELEMRGGFPRPDWDKVLAWVDRYMRRDQQDEAWTELSRDWLQQLAASQGGTYQVRESEHFLLLSSDDVEGASRMLRWCERARSKALNLLDGIAQLQPGKQVVLVLAPHERYMAYVADYYPGETDVFASAGVHIRQGFQHIAICGRHSPAHETLIAHEFAHALLEPYKLPIWLDEGVVQMVEMAAGASHLLHVEPSVLADQRKVWNAETIQHFWTGEAFTSYRRLIHPAYGLALQLVYRMAEDHGHGFAQFVRAARSQDSGSQALMEHCGTTLGKSAAKLLGPGDWEPRPECWEVDPADVVVEN